MINCWWMVLWPSLGRNTSSGLPHLTKTNAGQQIQLKSSLLSLTTDCMIGWQDLIDQYSTRYRRPLWVDCRQKKRKKSCFCFSKAADVALENILKVISLLEYCSCTWLSNNLDPVLTYNFWKNSSFYQLFSLPSIICSPPHFQIKGPFQLFFQSTAAHNGNHLVNTARWSGRQGPHLVFRCLRAKEII